jgi:alpha/beta superfamily hydrolase
MPMTSSQRLSPVTFENRDGLQLVGVMHEPATGASGGVAVVLLSPGIKSRTAPHRLYNKMASALTAQGFRVLRFDFHGLGDSEGAIDDPLLRDVYNSIQRGRFVDDALAALDWMQATFGTTRFVVGGLCGGALTGLLAAERDARIVGLVSLGLPVMLDASAADPMRYMTSGQLRSIRSRYVAKVRDREAWSRLLTFRSDYRLLFKALFKSTRVTQRSDAPVAPGSAATQTPANLNARVPPAFRAAVSRGCPMLLAFSEVDRLYWEFTEKFYEPNRSLFDRHARLVEVHVLKSANHVLTFPEWQADMMGAMRRWMERHFASVVVPAAAS